MLTLFDPVKRPIEASRVLANFAEPPMVLRETELSTARNLWYLLEREGCIDTKIITAAANKN